MICRMRRMRVTKPSRSRSASAVTTLAGQHIARWPRPSRLGNTRPYLPGGRIMIDPALIDRANDIIERLFALDEAVANAGAFRALLEELHKHDLSAVEEPHVTAIRMVRAGIL